MDIEDGYAFNLANESFRWYRTAAIRSRKRHRISAIAVLVVAAVIPVVAAFWPKNAMIPAVLGAGVVVISGARSIFHWEENYFRFSGAREAIEAERRLYLTGSSPYDSQETRDRILAAAVTSIEQQEMAGWLKLAAERNK